MSERPPADSFAVAVTALIQERGLTVRSLAKQAAVSPSHLSRTARAADNKKPSPDLMRRVARALNLSENHFLEARRATIHAAIENDPDLVDRTYASLAKRPSGRTPEDA